MHFARYLPAFFLGILMDSQKAAYSVYYESVSIIFEKRYMLGDPRGRHRVISILLQKRSVAQVAENEI